LCGCQLLLLHTQNSSPRRPTCSTAVAAAEVLRASPVSLLLLLLCLWDVVSWCICSICSIAAAIAVAAVFLSRLLLPEQGSSPWC
jgi:hypothetical protein